MKKILLFFIFTLLLVSCEETKKVSQNGVSPSTGDNNTSGSDFFSSPKSSARVFFSGHSLINLNMPAMVDAIANERGLDHDYQTQIGNGSNMNLRWQGGPNGEQLKDGSAFNFTFSINSLANQGHDTLVVTEAVGNDSASLENHVLYSDTLGYAKNFYDTIGDNGTVYLYEVWPYIVNGDYAEWITRTKNSTILWECVKEHVNTERSHLNSPMKLIPGARALANLVEAVLAGNVFDNSTDPSVLFSDTIHLTDLGNYYIALVQYSMIYQRSPIGVTRNLTNPITLQSYNTPNAVVAERMQQIAHNSIVNYTETHPTPCECRLAYQNVRVNQWERNTLIPSIFPDPNGNDCQ